MKEPNWNWGFSFSGLLFPQLLPVASNCGVFSCNSKSSGIGSLGFWLFRQDHKITDKLRDYMRVPGTRGEERGGKMSKKMRDSRVSIFTFRKHFGSFPLNDYHWHLSGQVCAMWQGNLGNTGGRGSRCCFLLFLFIFFFFLAWQFATPKKQIGVSLIRMKGRMNLR